MSDLGILSILLFVVGILWAILTLALMFVGETIAGWVAVSVAGTSVSLAMLFLILNHNKH